MRLRAFLVGPVDLDFSVDAPRAQDGRINQVRPVGGQDDHHVLQRLQAVHFRAEHRHQRAENAAVTAGAARAEDGFRLVNEQEGQRTFRRALAALGEQIAHLPLGFAHPHVENFRPFDVQEKFRMVHAGFGAGFAGADCRPWPCRAASCRNRAGRAAESPWAHCARSA